MSRQWDIPTIVHGKVCNQFSETDNRKLKHPNQLSKTVCSKKLKPLNQSSETVYSKVVKSLQLLSNSKTVKPHPVGQSSLSSITSQ